LYEGNIADPTGALSTRRYWWFNWSWSRILQPSSFSLSQRWDTNLVKVNKQKRSGLKARSEVTDKTYSGTVALVGKSHWNSEADPYLDADVAGVFVVDVYLSTNASSYVTCAAARSRATSDNLQVVDLTDCCGISALSMEEIQYIVE
jgi:hypothetical protein